MKKTLLIMTALLCSSFMFAWEWEKEGDTVTILPNEKSTTVGLSLDAPWFNSEIENLKIVISDGITGIKENTFKGSKNIVSVSIAPTVETIGTEAFRECEKLSEVNLPETLLKISDKAFFDCPLLNNVSVPGPDTEVGTDVFGSSSTPLTPAPELAAETIETPLTPSEPTTESVTEEMVKEEPKVDNATTPLPPLEELPLEYLPEEEEK